MIRLNLFCCLRNSSERSKGAIITLNVLEITTMVSLLKVIDNPLQDIPLVAVLRSGLVGLDEIALAYIRTTSKNTSYYEAVCQFVSDF